MISAPRALLESLLVLLRTPPDAGLGLDDGSCDLTSGGRPPATAPDVFLGLHASAGQSQVKTDYYERPTVTITVTARAAKVPVSKLGQDLIYAEKGLSDLLGAMRAWVARNFNAWREAANALLVESAGREVNGFYGQVLTIAEGNVREVGPEWFRSPPPTGPTLGPPGPAGVVCDLTVQGFEREHYLEVAT